MADEPVLPEPNGWDKKRYWIAGILSFLCLVGIVSKELWPSSFILDQTILLLLALGALPWLTLFLKKVSIPGFLSAESAERAQGQTKKPPAPRSSVQIANTDQLQLSGDAKKILATLWRYQNQHFHDDPTKRWTFTVFPTAPAEAYSSYLTGLGELVKAGLVVVSPENNQCMLTGEGIFYIQSHGEVIAGQDIYVF
jgi:hypothetical protein